MINQILQIDFENSVLVLTVIFPNATYVIKLKSLPIIKVANGLDNETLAVNNIET